VNAVFTVTLSAASGQAVTVAYATADQTATSNDYTATTGTLTFAAGTTTQTITVAVTGDTLDEASETFLVNLSNATNATLADSQAVGTITDNDTEKETGTASLSGYVYIDTNGDGSYAISATQNHTGLGGVTIRLQRTDLANQAETVRITKADGSYTFEDLAAGTYTLREDQPSKYIDGLDTAGSGPTTVGTAGSDQIAGIVLESGQTGVDYNFGESGLKARYYTAAMGLASTVSTQTLANQFSDNLVVGPADTVGLYDPLTSVFYLRNTNTTGVADLYVAFGVPDAGWLPIAGDWDGDGRDTVGLYDASTATCYLRASNTTGVADVTFAFGVAGADWEPIVGDWDGDGQDSVGLYDPGTATFYLRSSNSSGVATVSFAFGVAGTSWTPVAGDWNGDGQSSVGLYDPATGLFFLTNKNRTGIADTSYALPGVARGAVAQAGDWNGDSTDTVGVYLADTAYAYLAKTHSASTESLAVGYGAPGNDWLVLSGQWTEDGGWASLVAADGAATSRVATDTLQADQLQAIVDAAIAQWEAAGLCANAVETLRQVRVTVADLAGAQLGAARGDEVVIDRDAAGYGWFVDPTPMTDEEYRTTASGSMQALDPASVDQIDLESVVLHELGHIAGLDDLASSAGVMEYALRAGTRRLPSTADVLTANR
jgi:hypothetical protein